MRRVGGLIVLTLGWVGWFEGVDNREGLVGLKGWSRGWAGWVWKGGQWEG